MIKRILSLLLLLATTSVFAQSGSIRGTVTEKANGEGIPAATVLVKQGGEIIANGGTDFDGLYTISPINPGNYDVEVQSFGQQTMTIKQVLVRANAPTVLDFKMVPESEVLTTVEVVWEKPLIERGKTSEIRTQEEIKNLPVRNLSQIAATTAGVFAQNDGSGNVNVRGARSSTNVQIVDGIRLRGNVVLPRDAIAQTEIITGGLPAQYGDATGGIINTTTRGPQPNFFGSTEFLTSSPFDSYHYNLVNMTVGGPIYKKKREGGGENTVIGFLFSGDFQYQADPRPVALDVYKVKDDKLAQLEATPVQASSSGQGVLPSASFLYDQDLETSSARLNANRSQIRLNGSVTFKTGARSSLSLRGNYNYFNGMNYSLSNSLMNYNNNSQTVRNDWVASARFQQSFGDPESTSIVKNAFYQIQVDYQRNQGSTYDPRFGEDIFKYGHLGSFDTRTTNSYTLGESEVITDPNDPNFGRTLTGWVHNGFRDTAVIYTPGANNPILSNYTSEYYRLVNNGTLNNTTNSISDIRSGQALVNGDQPAAVYGLWGNVGAVQTGYNKFRNSQFRVTANTTFEIKGHSLRAGFEFEQRFDRGYGVGATGIWNQMRQLQNFHISQLDLDNPMPVYDDFGVYQDTVNYARSFDGGVPRTFDRNVRRKLGLDPNGLDVIDIDSYDPDFFSLDMFSADELLNIGATQYVAYNGFDYQGNVTDSRPGLEDFFTADENGVYQRQIGAFEPIYMAGYIQDQFTFEDIFFNVGVRIDRFDANQSILKDQFLLYPAFTVGEKRNEFSGEIPSNIGDDYVIYVDDASSSSPNIVGFRDGNTWYTAEGEVEPNFKNIEDQGKGGIQPYLKYGTDAKLETTYNESFVDYSPQVTVSPRISFQFPISDEAEFFAHYDLLVQRPDPGFNRMDPVSYLLMENGVGGTLANADLRPIKTTDYELGFRQKLNDYSALKITSFYREMRDMTQIVGLYGAYPVSYLTYGNQDYGTVKGFSLGYDLRRIGNVQMNVNYTLQFADGTGSGPNSGANLAQSGQPNLRYILPLDYDSRHQLVLNIDYRYRGGAAYNGPRWGGINWFENAGINLLMTGSSGTPYTRRSRAYALTEAASSVPLTGNVNGSRLPWTFNVDMTVNKSWDVNWTDSKKGNVEVFVQVENLLNAFNVLNVYPFTGSPEDDGFLASPQGQTSIAFRADAEAYRDLYNARVANPFNYALPRQIRLGVRLGF